MVISSGLCSAGAHEFGAAEPVLLRLVVSSSLRQRRLMAIEVDVDSFAPSNYPAQSNLDPTVPCDRSVLSVNPGADAL